MIGAEGVHTLIDATPARVSLGAKKGDVPLSATSPGQQHTPLLAGLLIDFTQKYDRGAWLSFLEDSFLPDDFNADVREVPFSEKLVYAQSVTKLGESAELGLTVFEIKHKSTNDARVGLSKEAFRLVCNYTLHSRALVLFVPQDKDDFYRFSLVEFTLIVRDDGKVRRDYSNPRRYSFILGRDAKVKTPEQYLIQKGRVKDTADLKNRFSVEVLTKEFYSGLFKWYDDWAIKEVAFPEGFGASAKLVGGDKNRIHLIRLITRLIFVWFIKQKRLIPEWVFDKGEVAKVLKTFESDSLADGTYYNGIIQNLFFATLNKPIKERGFANEKAGDRKEDYGIKTVYRDRVDEGLFKISRDEFISRFDAVPFLNGGLFECLDNFDDKSYMDGFSREKDRCAFVPNALFWGDGERLGIIELFNLYNFTIEENTPQDVDVALDPELLGKAFENLLGTFNPETLESARNATGSFYTPREIVSYMVDSSLKEYFKNYLKDDANADTKLEALFSYQDEGHSFVRTQVETLISAINNSKILDPACGSGAFPMGILQRLVHILGKLDPGNKLWEDIQRKKAVEETEEAYKIGDTEKRNERLIEISAIFQQNSDDYGRKLFLIENCIYGIDIQPIAIQISKLRFFISLIVNQEKGKNKDDNYGIRPLPNLETKFVAANTLIGIKRESGVLVDPEIAKVQKQLLLIRHQHFSARNAEEKIELRKEDRRLAQKLAELLKNDGFYNSHDAEQMAKWNPYGQNTPSDFFDPEWMFGAANGFDVVIGNPPYVQLPPKDLGEYKFAQGNNNTYVAFIERALQLQTNRAVLTFIVPTSWFSGDKFTFFRDGILQNYNLYEIVQLPYDIFKNAYVDTAILFLKNEKPSGNTKYYKYNIRDVKRKLRPEDFITFPSFEWLRFGKVFLNNELLLIGKKFWFPGKNVKLGEIAKINRGCLPPKTEETSNERTPFYDIRWFNDQVFRYTIEKAEKKEYVNYESLRENKPISLYQAKKILARQLMSRQFRMNLTYVDEEFAFKKNLYAIYDLQEEYAYKFVLAILNSRLFSFMQVNFNTSLQRDDFPAFSLSDFREFPIPKIDTTQQQPFVEIVDQILEAKGRGEETAELEARIDKMVYGVYGLGEEEIKVVEGKND